MGLVSVADRCRAALVLLQYALADDLLDVAWDQVNGQGEAVTDTGKLDPLVPERTDDVLERLLTRRDEPQASVLLLACLREALQVEHPVDAARDVLPDLVNNKDDAVEVGSAPLQQLKGSLGEP